MKIAHKKIFAPFKDDLTKFNSHFAAIMSSDVKLVDQIAKYIVKHKGKQFRPALLIVSARTISEPGPATFRTAAVVELLHTASLVHDDVLDDAELRRGIRTIHKVWKNKIAVLMGDYLLAKSLIVATETGSLEVMNTIATVAKRLIKGEIFEIQKARKLDITEAEYFKLIGDKTASLISACCQLGALTVQATTAQQEALKKYGEQLGLAFQIKDDLLDYESESGILGKPALSDLKSKKITLPLLYAFQETTDKDRKKIFKMIKNGAAKKDMNYILDFVTEHYGIQRANQKAADIKAKAVAALSELPPTPARDSLESLAEFVLNRAK
ncbi:polyprenyl synthetase family protein [Candidatus Saccharibacteria bacterium]|nr:polyprenyl synthetase family protein [Candidatus Saccharibacteria bacterium]NIV03126.1 polyprenyl synthetase family protein [Calditrichia bacterium]NIV97690.1 polyprenyl synthetase family protein [Candidatus Saccharibacteria bacterium]NIW77995.1 polyprenyl synthetase family protein [Calditrichia bacterium]